MFDVKEFTENYSRAYSTFYNSDDSVIHCIEYHFTKMFDARYNTDKDFTAMVNAFIKHRQDLITSDREAAAFCVTYMVYNNEV